MTRSISLTNFLDLIARNTIPDQILILDDMGGAVAARSDVRPDIPPRGPFFKNSAPDGDGLAGFKHYVFGDGVLHASIVPEEERKSSHFRDKR